MGTRILISVSTSLAACEPGTDFVAVYAATQTGDPAIDTLNLALYTRHMEPLHVDPDEPYLLAVAARLRLLANCMDEHYHVAHQQSRMSQLDL